PSKPTSATGSPSGTPTPNRSYGRRPLRRSWTPSHDIYNEFQAQDTRACLEVPLSYCAAPRRRLAALSSVDSQTRLPPSSALRGTTWTPLATDGDFETGPSGERHADPARRTARVR